MSPMSLRCPKCRAGLKLKDEHAQRRRVTCPKCRHRFAIPGPQEPATDVMDDSDSESGATDELSELMDLDLSDRRRTGSALRKKRPRTTRRPAPPPEAEPSPGRAIFSLVVWFNANAAVAICIVDSLFDLGWMLTHFGELYQQVGLGRLAVRQLARPLIVILTAGAIWFQAVLPRDIGMRGAVGVFGAGYLLLFGAVAYLVGWLAQSIYERPVYAIQWSVIYLGVSLLAFVIWGYAPETPLERAERLTASGSYSDALTAVNEVLEQDPTNEEALELERSLRDMIRFS